MALTHHETEPHTQTPFTQAEVMITATTAT